jgi:hypothetical protein
VSAAVNANNPSATWIENPVVVGTGPGSGAQTVSR